MLDDYILDFVSVVILLGLLWIYRMSIRLVVQKYLAAFVTCALQRCLYQVSEAYVHHRQFEGYVAEVTGALIVFVSARFTSDTGIDNTHLWIHQSLLERMTIIFVGISSLHLYGRHFANFVGIHQGELDGLNPLWNLCCVFGTHLLSSSSSLIATPRLFISSKSSLNAYDVWTECTSARSPQEGQTVVLLFQS